MENAGSWTVSGSKEGMEVPKNFKNVEKNGAQSIAQYNAANFSRVPFPVFFFTPTLLLPYYSPCLQECIACQRSKASL